MNVVKFSPKINKSLTISMFFSASKYLLLLLHTIAYRVEKPDSFTKNALNNLRSFKIYLKFYFYLFLFKSYFITI